MIATVAAPTTMDELLESLGGISPKRVLLSPAPGTATLKDVIRCVDGEPKRLVELIDAGSEHVSADVSKHMLAIAGIKPAAEPTTLVNVNIRAGYVIDLSDDPPRTIDVTQKLAARE